MLSLSGTVLLLMGMLMGLPTASLAGQALPAAPVGDDPLMLSPEQAAATLGAKPSAPDLPDYAFDWSLGLRGSYINDSQSGVRYEQQVLPSVTLTHNAQDLSLHATADAQLSKTDNGEINIDDARLSAGSALQFDPASSLVSNGTLEVTQEDPNSPDVAGDVATTPVETSGEFDSTFTRRFGRFNASVSGNAQRQVYGPTTLVDGTQTDNAGLNNTSGGGGLRVGFQLTPVIELFTAVNATRAVFDAPSPTLTGVKLDGNLYTAMVGASAKWDETLWGSASVGFGTEHFDDTSLADVRSVLYDASLTFKPTSTLTLSGNFATAIAPPGPDGSGSAGVTYAAAAGATYQVNDWLDYRSSAGWTSTTYADSSQTNKGYALGLGADYSLSGHSKVSADYNFDHTQQSFSLPDDTHTVTLGLTFQK
ncbi:MAG TPA: outer membrane beta-barrel protein [Devosiaceae bacterium]|nr:outer membrane beta-barrel protein [Devosiaceae bacterium]